MLGLLLWIAYGALIGWFTGAIIKDSSGILINIVTGIAGAVVAGLIYNSAYGHQLNEFSIARFGIVILGAIGMVFLRRQTLKANH